MSLADLALLTGISEPMLSKIENAHTSCSLTTLATLAESLDVPANSLFRDADIAREAVYTQRATERIVARGGHG
jgi:transcriptional regulator with XRE-family HTH domain